MYVNKCVFEQRAQRARAEGKRKGQGHAERNKNGCPGQLSFGHFVILGRTHKSGFLDVEQLRFGNPCPGPQEISGSHLFMFFFRPFFIS